MDEVTLEGLPEFDSQIDLLIKQLSAEKVEPIVLAGATIIADAARTNAPQGPTSNLKKACIAKLLSRIDANPRRAIAAVNRKRAPHAHWIEFGTSRMRIPKKKTVMKGASGKFYGRAVGPIPAHPFFRPAWDANKDRVREDIIDELKKLVESVGKDVY